MARPLNRWMYRKLSRHWLSVVILVFLVYLYVTMITSRSSDLQEELDYDYDFQDDDDEQKDSDKGRPGTIADCIRPPLELMPENFKQYFAPPIRSPCSPMKNAVHIHDGVASMAGGALFAHGAGLKCFLTPIIRQSDFLSRLDKNNTVPVEGRHIMDSDFCKVECFTKDSQKKVYSNVHSTIVAKPHLSQPAPFPASGLQLNIMILGFDSVSRLSWLRNLPKTHEWFTTKMGGVVLEGYNIVGDGTPQALLPILAGKTEDDLPELRRGHSGARPLDGLSWVWRDLSAAGYATQWGEDGANFGTFQYRMLGFNDQPVDHYMRPFYLFAEETYGQNRPYCLGDTRRHINMFQWGRQFFQAYQHRPCFSFLFHSELSHDSPNRLQVVDDDLLGYMEGLNKDGFLDNTLLVLMSDHGIRYEAMRNTMQGKYEERLPYMGLLIPQTVRRRYPELYANLRGNANKLTTPFDLHETLHDVLHFDANTLSDIPPVNQRGISLFREIPLSRSCPQAGIEPHWCSCLRWVTIDITDDSFNSISWAVMRHLNEITQDFRVQCEELRLSKIIRAEMFAAEATMLKFKGSKDLDGRIPDFGGEVLTKEVLYQITIQTTPNGGVYEVTLKHDLIEDQYVVDPNQISRINRYGDDPACIMQQQPHLRPYCYCRDRKTNRPHR